MNRSRRALTPRILRQRVLTQRPLRSVSKSIWVLLVAGIAAQLILQSWWQARTPERVQLPSPPSLVAVEAFSLGDPWVVAKSLTLWLQAFDHQPGINISYAELDYHHLAAWLDLIEGLDPRAHYPFLLATRIYGSIADRDRVKIMLNHVHQGFVAAPRERWRWMAEGSMIAKYRLKDQALALHYADQLATLANDPNVPPWAKTIRILLLEEMGEVATAEILLGGLIESGQITDPYELRFLEQKLSELRQEAGSIP